MEPALLAAGLLFSRATDVAKVRRHVSISSDQWEEVARARKIDWRKNRGCAPAWKKCAGPIDDSAPQSRTR